MIETNITINNLNLLKYRPPCILISPLTKNLLIATDYGKRATITDKIKLSYNADISFAKFFANILTQSTYIFKKFASHKSQKNRDFQPKINM